MTTKDLGQDARSVELMLHEIMAALGLIALDGWHAWSMAAAQGEWI